MANNANPQKIPGFGLRGSFGTSTVGGFGDDPKFRFMVKGLSAETGRLRLSHPPMADLVFRDDAGVCTLRSKGEFFNTSPNLPYKASMIEEFLENFAELHDETGFYIINHANMRSNFLGKTWDEAVSYLGGKYIGDGPLEAIQDHPTDPKQLRATAANRWGSRFEDHAQPNHP